MLSIFAGGIGTAGKVMWNKINAQQEKVEGSLLECREEHKKAAERLDVVQQDLRSLNRIVGRLEGKAGIIMEGSE